MDDLLRTEELTKDFGEVRAVSGLSIGVRTGDVYGFLGPNGAGKTTTIRMVLRLVRPSKGAVFLFGKDARRHFLEVARKIGGLVEVPGFYGYLSGRENLEIFARLSGVNSSRQIDQVLEWASLVSAAGVPVRTYSQGMRQRLGIAQALLGSPELVILDEPTNGLDPEGIAEMRQLFRKLNREAGVTFFISSHLLYEVEQLCNRVGILRDGKLVVEDTVERLLSETSGHVLLGASPQGRARELVTQFPSCTGVSEAPNGKLWVSVPPESIAALNAFLVARDVQVFELSQRRLTLEDYFLRLSGKLPAA